MTSFFIGLLQQSAPTGGAASSLTNIMPIVLVFGVFYFLIIRPQSKKAKIHQQMLTQLKKGDDVVTSGGIIGRITGIKDDEVTLQVQEGVRIRVLRSAITGPQRPAAEPAKVDTKAPVSS